ncbi:MAG TPA: hypothetical protein VGB82_09855 [Alphaproteobacteria bacterium]
MRWLFRSLKVGGFLSGLALACATLVCLTGSAVADPSTVDDKLAALNTLARAHYAKAKTATLAGLGPIIVVEPDALVLVRGDEQRREVYLPDRYRQLKSIAHAAMGLYSLVEPHADKNDFAAWHADLAAYRGQLAELLPEIGEIGLHWDDAKRQRRMLSASLDFMDRIQAARRVSTADLRAYADDVGPILSGDLYDAAQAELASLDKTVKLWRSELGPDEWSRVYVVVLGLGRPRERHPPYDYFVRLLGPDAVDTRLIHADNITDTAGALDLLATTVNDRRMAEAFFSDPARIDHGLMRDATKRHLDKMFP